MRRAVFNIEPFDWAVEVCIAIRKLDGGYVLSRLSELGASRKVMLSAADLIDSWSPNKGLTYSGQAHEREHCRSGNHEFSGGVSKLIAARAEASLQRHCNGL